MKGLITKDLYMSAGYGKFFLIISGLMLALSVAVQPGESMLLLFFPVLLCAAMVMGLMNYDDASGWSRYVGTIPCTRAQIVTARYIVAAILLGGTLALVALARVASMLIYGGFSLGTLLEDMSLPFIMSSLMVGIALPVMYRFGAEKGRLAYMVITGVVCSIACTFVLAMNQNERNSEIPGSTLAVFCLVAAVLFALSWWLSVVFYRKKELA